MKSFWSYQTELQLENHHAFHRAFWNFVELKWTSQVLGMPPFPGEPGSGLV